MEDANICFICQDFEKNVGHTTKWCPKNVCQKCGQNGHAKTGCMFGMEDFPLPNEILLQILGYISGKDLKQSIQNVQRDLWYHKIGRKEKAGKKTCDVSYLQENSVQSINMESAFESPQK